MQKAFDILEKAYAGDCGDLVDRAKAGEKFFTPVAAKSLKEEHLEDYQAARDGEWSRLREE